MKRLVVLVFIFVVAASAQHEHQVSSGVKLGVGNDLKQGVLTIQLGPLNLPANTDHMAVTQPGPFILNIPFDGWITAYHPRLRTASGEAVPSHLLHHVAFWNLERSDFLCPGKPEHIFGAGGEMNDWPSVPGIGYRVSRGDRIRITSMFHNPTATSYAAYLEVKIEYIPASTGEALRNVYPAWFDVKGCGDSSYDLVAGSNENTGEFKLAHPGTLLGVGGHLHDYGQRLVLFDATRDRQIAALDAQADARGRLLGMPHVVFAEGGYRLHANDVIKVTAKYDNRAGHALPQGAMGIVVGYFLPDDENEMAGLKK
jgi:hypothetical protein